MSFPLRSLSSWLAPLALGAFICAGLWFFGLPEFGWLGFLVAAFAWPAVRQALDERPGASKSDGDRSRAR